MPLEQAAAAGQSVLRHVLGDRTLFGQGPQIIQVLVIESWLQIESQDRQGHDLFCVIAGQLGRVREKKTRYTLDLLRVERQQKSR